MFSPPSSVDEGDRVLASRSQGDLNRQVKEKKKQNNTEEQKLFHQHLQPTDVFIFIIKPAPPRTAHLCRAPDEH